MPLYNRSDLMTQIQLAKQFTRYPGGRYRKHGDGSGQEFREDYLLPAFKSDEAVIVSMDDTAGYPASFLEEAFGGLIRAGITFDEIKRKLTLLAEKDEFKAYPEIAWRYIEDAAEHLRVDH